MHPLAEGQSWSWYLTPWLKSIRVPLSSLSAYVYIKFESDQAKSVACDVNLDFCPRDQNQKICSSHYQHLTYNVWKLWRKILLAWYSPVQFTWRYINYVPLQYQYFVVPSTALYRSFLEYCTLAKKTVEIIWRIYSKPPEETGLVPSEC